MSALKAAGADMIKTYELSASSYRLIAAEARRAGLPFGGHLHGADLSHSLTPVEASDLGASIIDHNDRSSGGLGRDCLDDEKSTTGRSSDATCRPIAERFQRNNTWSVPTILNTMGPAADAMLKRFDQAVPKFWQSDTVFRLSWGPGSKRAPGDSLGSMYVARRVGLPIMAGTDAMMNSGDMSGTPGFGLHVVLALYVAEGLSPLESLQTATLNPAKFLHATDSLGTVAVGKLADLVLLDADPLADITNTTTIRAVVANGRYFDRAALDRLLASVRIQAKQAPGTP